MLQELLKLINIISIVIPVVVAILLGIQNKLDLGTWTSILPKINAVINSTTAILLLLGLYFIKSKRIEMHKKFMSSAFILGGLLAIVLVSLDIS